MFRCFLHPIPLVYLLYRQFSIIKRKDALICPLLCCPRTPLILGRKGDSVSWESLVIITNNLLKWEKDFKVGFSLSSVKAV